MGNFITKWGGYYNEGRPVLQNRPASRYYKTWHKLLQIVVGYLLHSETIITIEGQVLQYEATLSQSGAVITKWSNCYKVGQNEAYK